MVTQLETLNRVDHADLRMRTGLEGSYPHFVPIVVGEFPAAASCCPIFFAKDASTGQFYAAALFGFEPGELLVEGAERGDAVFRPLELQRQGFHLSDDNISIDINHLRFNGGTAALFEAGEPSDTLRRIQRVLGELHAGFEATRAFVRELLALKLVEPVDITLSFDDGSSLTLDGLYTVSRDALAELDDSAITALFRNGHLQAALCMSFSLNQVAVLASKRNRRLAE